jgi:hypothetical protein
MAGLRLRLMDNETSGTVTSLTKLMQGMVGYDPVVTRIREVDQDVG